MPWSTAAVISYLSTTPSDLRNLPRTKDRNAHPVHRPRWFVVDGVIAALLAALPALHVRQVVERQSALVSDAVVNQLYYRAARLSEQLSVLGVAEIAGQPTAGVVDDLRNTVAGLQQAVQVPLPADATTRQRLSRVRQWYSLGRFDQVELVLQPVVNNPQAQLRLALADEARQRYEAAAAGYRRTIELLESSDALDRDQLSLLRSAYERRVNNLRRIGQNRQAEQELLAGLKRWPQVRDAFLLQLGFHYQMAGRTGEAIDYFQRAAEANPQLQPQTDAMLLQLRRQAEGCLLRPAQGATR